MASYDELPPLKDGTQRIKITVELGYDELTGKRLRPTKTVRMKSMSDRAIKKAITDFEIEVAKEKDKVKLENITFEKFVDRWMNVYVKVDLAINTRDAYNGALDGGILEYFRDMRMEKIKTFHIVEFFSKLKKDNKKNLSGKFICLKSIFRKATTWKLIKENPMDGVDQPTDEKREYDVDFYDETLLKKLFSILNNVFPKYRVQIKIAALVGLRLTEIAGIRKENINYNNNTILIDKKLEYDREAKKFVLSKTKNKKERTVYVPSDLMKEIKKYDVEHSKLKLNRIDWNPLLDDEGEPINLLFTKNDGFPAYPKQVSTAWQKLIVKHNLPTMPFHGFRHTCASYMVSKNINFKIIQEQLGHSDIKMTIEKYSHLTKIDKSDAMNLFNEIL